MVNRIAFFHFAVVDIADDILVFVRIQFLAEMDFVDFLALEKLFVRDATEVVYLHEIHHVIGPEHRI